MSDQRDDEEQPPAAEPTAEPEGAHPSKDERTSYGVEDEELA
jgi:hypothetical protein